MTTKKQIANVGGRWQFKRTGHGTISRRVGGDGCLFSVQIVTACGTLVKTPMHYFTVSYNSQGGTHGRLD